jgi:hypothetical protein
MSSGGMFFDYSSDNNPYQQIWDYQGGDQPIYIGWATPGVAQTSPQWRIKLYTYTTVTIAGSPVSVLTQIQFVNGDVGFHSIWANRTAYAYM